MIKKNKLKISGLSNIKKIYAENTTSMAINEDGELFVWGYKFSKTPKKLETYSKVVDVAERYYLTEDGSVWSLQQRICMR